MSGFLLRHGKFGEKGQIPLALNLGFLLLSENLASLPSGHMKNYQDDFIILHTLRIKGRYPISPSIIHLIRICLRKDGLKLTSMEPLEAPLGKQVVVVFLGYCRGFINGYFSLYLDIRCAFEAEIFGFMVALEFAFKFGWQNLWVETNSIYVVLLFKNQSFLVLWKIRNRCIHTLSYVQILNTRISHILKEGNCVADKIDSMVSTSNATFGGIML